MSRQPERPPMDKLPDYFPTVHKNCVQAASEFFECFDKHAIMTGPTDCTTAKTSLTTCQRQLQEYAKCMESNHNRSGKVWWKVW